MKVLKLTQNQLRSIINEEVSKALVSKHIVEAGQLDMGNTMHVTKQLRAVCAAAAETGELNADGVDLNVRSLGHDKAEFGFSAGSSMDGDMQMWKVTVSKVEAADDDDDDDYE